MPKLTVTLYGRDYPVSCADGQERRVQELAAYVEQKMLAVANSIGNTTENRLFMLTCMMMADELMEMRDNRDHRRTASPSAQALAAKEEEYLLGVIARMQHRLDSLTATAGNA